MEYVANTVAIVRYFAKKGRIPSRALRILRDANDGKHTIAISVMSLIEILYRSERRRISIDLDRLRTELDEQSNYRIIDLDAADCEKAGPSSVRAAGPAFLVVGGLRSGHPTQRQAIAVAIIHFI
jgi:predicted nucleic acid-binding protein